MAKINDVFCLFWTLCTVGINIASALTGRSGCSEVKIAYGSVSGAINPNEVPQFAIPGEELRICSNSFSCCTPKMETKLVQMAEEQFEEKVRDKTSMLRDFFVRRTQKFDDYMKELIDISRHGLDQMFLITYGPMYRDNSDLFMDLFTSLRNFYFGIDIDLDQVMEDFFFVLFQKMFELLNMQYEYTNDFWMCTGHYIDELQPFDGIPAKLTVQVRRSVTAARTFVQGLGIGRDVITDVSKVVPGQSCQEALTRMSQCSACNGHTDVLPCYSLCQNIMRGCLSSEAELQQEWNRYVEAMSSLAERLEGPFNVDAVLSTIDLEISNGIMIMQEQGIEITRKVMEGCGPLQTKRSKRASGSRTSKKKTSSYSGGNVPERPSIDHQKLLKDIRKKLKDWERIWTSLPYDVCDDPMVAADVTDEINCWNGETVGRYSHDLVGNGIQNQIDNPEVMVDLIKPSFVVRKQIIKLRTITQQLNNAIEGRAADYIDSEYTGSGSGSGSGSGDGSDPNEFNPVEDPKYRPTIKPTPSAGVLTTGSWSCLLALLLVAVVFRW